MKRLVRLTPPFLILLALGIVGVAILHTPEQVTVAPIPTRTSTPEDPLFTPDPTFVAQATFVAQHPPTPLPTITPDPSWRTVQHFTGYQPQTTPQFTLSGKWRVVWYCSPARPEVSATLSASLLDAQGQVTRTVTDGVLDAEGDIFNGYSTSPERVSLQVFASFMRYDFTVQEWSG